MKTIIFSSVHCVHRDSYANNSAITVLNVSVRADHEEDNSVAVFVWSAEFNSQLGYFVALFDINQWYQAQMPNVVRWKKPKAGYVW